MIGGSSLRVSWEKDGQRIIGEDPRVTVMENGTLHITKLKVCNVCVCVSKGMKTSQMYDLFVLV